jgi:hypothetical protein
MDQKPPFNRLLTALREKPGFPLPAEPALKHVPASSPRCKTGGIPMKSFIVLTAVAVLTLGNAIAAKPGAVSTQDAVTAQADAAPILSMADQELPFDRYWSKN